MREKKQQQQIPFHKKCPKVSWPTNGRASFRTPFLLLTIRSAQAQRLQPLTPEMCVKLTSYQTNITLCKKNTVPPPDGSRGGARGAEPKLKPEGQKICFLDLTPTLHGLYDQPPSPLSVGLDPLLKQDDFYYKVNKIMSSCQKLLCVSFGKY